MATHPTFRTLALSLVLVSGTAQAGLFSKKKAPPPPPPEPAPVVVPEPPPPPPAPIPLEYTGNQKAPPMQVPMDRVRSASPEVQATIDWVAASKDNAGLPFIVIDKVNAQVYAFTPHAQLKATAPILLGMGVGDVALVSQDAPMSAIPPEKRITPAGRYVSRLAKEPSGKVILSIDPINLISLHIVAKGTPAQRRAERLASQTSLDNRVSFGCINVPPAFFTEVVSPDFAPRKGVVYVLPEKTTAGQLFGFAPAPTAPTSPTAPMAGQATMTAAVSSTPGAVQPSSSLSLGLPQAAPAAVGTAQAATMSVDFQQAAPLPAAPQTASPPAELPQASPVTSGGAAAVSAPDSH